MPHVATCGLPTACKTEGEILRLHLLGISLVLINYCAQWFGLVALRSGADVIPELRRRSVVGQHQLTGSCPGPRAQQSPQPKGADEYTRGGIEGERRGGGVEVG